MTVADRVHPQGNYLPATVVGSTVISAGMTPRRNGALVASACVAADDGDGEIGVEYAAELAGVSARRAVEACRQALPDGARLVRPLTMTVYVRSRPDFTGHSDVADGASAAVADCFEGLVAARAAVGVASLPGGSPVEVVLTAEWAAQDPARAGRLDSAGCS